MAMSNITSKTRIGFHYYPDTLHYRKADLERWLPRLAYLGASWVTLTASPHRAIPEFFIQALVAQSITPVIHLPCRCDANLKLAELKPLLDAYARWGVEYIAIFDRPNSRQAWSAAAWAQGRLVEQFLDRFIPLAEAITIADITPVFPPLEPGGDYWDTVFLSQALKALSRRGYAWLLERLALGAYGWTYGKALSWGAGGPERWSKTHPYVTPANSEDQRGFHCYDWYQAQVKWILQRPLPLLLIGAGCRLSECNDQPDRSVALQQHADQNLKLAKWLRNDPETIAELGMGAPPVELKAVNFWILAAEADDPAYPDVWFPVEERPLPVVDAFSSLNAPSQPPARVELEHPMISGDDATQPGHYILISNSLLNDEPWMRQVALPFAKRKHARLGSSPEQALRARRVTILGNEKWLDETLFNLLRERGCTIEEVYGDGIFLATKLAHL